QRRGRGSRRWGGPAWVGDAVLDLLDRHRRLVDAEHTRVLTRRRAGPTGEFGEVVRRVEQFDGAGQLSAVHRVVELGDEVAQRAALVAEGHTAVHAARGLAAQLLGVSGLIDLDRKSVV